MIKNSRIILLILILASLVFAGAFSFKKPKTNKYILELTVSGEARHIQVNSNIDGELGDFYAGTVKITLTKSVHTLTITSQGYEKLLINTDLSKGDLKKTIKLLALNEYKEIVLKDYDGFKGITVENCTNFGDNTWFVCMVKNQDFGEKNIYRLVNNEWKYVTSGSYLTSYDLEGLDAPKELINYLDN